MAVHVPFARFTFLSGGPRPDRVVPWRVALELHLVANALPVAHLLSKPLTPPALSFLRTATVLLIKGSEGSTKYR